jgi:hypothetical protein
MVWRVLRNRFDKTYLVERVDRIFSVTAFRENEERPPRGAQVGWWRRNA